MDVFEKMREIEGDLDARLEDNFSNPFYKGLQLVIRNKKRV